MGSPGETPNAVTSLLPVDEESFTGTYARTLDEKARAVLPSGPWREQFASGAKLSIWNGRLALWTQQGFRSLVNEVRSQERIGAVPKGAYSDLLAGTHDVTPDSAGRIVLPPDQRRRVGIDDKAEVALVGQNNRVEIWAATRREAEVGGRDLDAAAKAFDDFLY